MGLISLYKCPRCWESDCVCETDAHGDRKSIPQVRQQSDQRVVDLLIEQNRLLEEIADKTEQRWRNDQRD